MKHTKIDWVDCTCNPVVGCKNGCPYCYARKLNDRFHFIDDWSEPKFFSERLKQFESKKPKSVFINSMSDIGFWEDEWKEKVFHAMCKNPQHSYIALTKCEEVSIPYWVRQELRGKFFLGQTKTSGTVFNGFNEKYRDFLSVEPLLGELHFNGFGGIRAVIIGAETGKRKDKVVPKREWIEKIVAECDSTGVAVFMKESLRTIMGCDFRQDKLPWEHNQ